MNNSVSVTHRLVLPSDSNHFGTLYAGSILRMALEAAYAAASRNAGSGANLVLRRVLSLECYKPVNVGTLVELKCIALHITRVYQVIGVLGTIPDSDQSPWMDSLMGFVQVDEQGQVAEFPEELTLQHTSDEWNGLRRRMEKLLRLRVKLTD